MAIPADQKFSGFADGGTLAHDDIVVGLRNGVNTRFSYQGEPGIYLPLAGGTMSGAIIMGGNSITDLPAPTNPTDAATKAYVDSTEGSYLPLAGGTMSGAITMGSNFIHAVTDPVSAQDAATKAYVDSTTGAYLPLAGGTMTGDIVFATTKGIETGTTAANTMLLKAYNTNTASYTTMGTLTAGNPPTFDLITTTTIGGAYIYRVGGTDVAVADGGTGASTLTNHGVLLGQGTSPVSALTLTNNQIMIGNTGADPSATTLTLLMDSVFGSAQGDVLYRNASGWVVLAPGTSGQFLQTLGAASNVQWASGNSGTVTSVATNNGLTGGTITTTGTIGLAAIASNNLLANATGGSAVPVATTLTALIDAAIGSAQGDILYRNASGWVVLAPGTSGQFLQTQGAAANPLWVTSATVTPAALSKVDDTNVTLTLGGTPATALLQATSLTLGWTGQLSLTRGGSNADLSAQASNGGIVWSNATQMQILAGTATARQMLQSGSTATPAWSTTSWPATSTAGRLLYSTFNNVIDELTTTASAVLTSTAGAVPQWSLLTGFANAPVNTNITSMTGLTGTLQAPTGITSSTGAQFMLFAYAASAVNYLLIGSNATGLPPVINAIGSDTNIDLNVGGKGTGAVNILGASTNSNAPTGYVGEILSSVIAQASAVSLSNNASANVTSLALAAGDYDVWGNVTLNGGSTTLLQYFSVWTSNSSASTPDPSLWAGNSYGVAGLATFAENQVGMPTPYRRVSLSGPTTIFLSVIAGFTTSTCTACGGIYARRVR